MWSILYDIQSLAFGIYFWQLHVFGAYLTNRTGLPVIKSTHKLLQAYLQSVSRNDPRDMESIILETSKSSNVTTSQIRFYTGDEENDFRMVLPDIHPGPFSPVGGVNSPIKSTKL
ncbi:MAG: hypothetical protein CM1200mP23_3530 [Nitrososphaerota archaeon]|nr:MAG: hypothetical protein CM1200mP23_3530 [Nitrososphaerota archaeon]